MSASTANTGRSTTPPPAPSSSCTAEDQRTLPELNPDGWQVYNPEAFGPDHNPLNIHVGASRELVTMDVTDRGASSNACMIHAMLGRNFDPSTAQNLRDAISTKLMDWLDFNKGLELYPENEHESVTLCRGYYLQMLYRMMPMIAQSQTQDGDAANTEEFNALTLACADNLATLNIQMDTSQKAVTIHRLIADLDSDTDLDKGERTSLANTLIFYTQHIKEFVSEYQPSQALELANLLRVNELADPKTQRKALAESLRTKLSGAGNFQDSDNNLMTCLTNKNIVDTICTTMIGQEGRVKFLGENFAPLIHLAVNKVLHDDMNGEKQFKSIYGQQESDTQEEGVIWLHKMEGEYNVASLPTLVIYSPSLTSGENYSKTTCVLGTIQQAEREQDPHETQETNGLECFQPTIQGGGGGLVEVFFNVEANLALYRDKAHEISQRRFNATSQPEVRRLYIRGNGGAHYYQLTQKPSSQGYNNPSNVASPPPRSIGDHNTSKIASPPPRQGSGCCKYIIALIATFGVALLAHKHIALISLKLGVSIATLNILIYVIPVIIAFGLYLHYRKKNQMQNSIAATASPTPANRHTQGLEAAVPPQSRCRSSQASPSESNAPPELTSNPTHDSVVLRPVARKPVAVLE